MIYVIIIAVVFTGLAGGIFWAAGRGKLSRVTGPMLSQTAAGRRTINLLLALTYVGFGIVIPAVFLVGNHDRASAQVGGVKLTAADKTGRELFGEHCAVCHTLAAASAVGKTGPNLDQIRPSESLVLHTIQYGCLENPPSGSSPENCLGYGTMPADVVQGREAQEVAHFVARVAGH
jgi:mono/diheme cytochrome c family protein